MAIDYYLQALAIFRTLYAYDRQLQTSYDISNLYNTLQNTAKSREYLQQAYQLARNYNQNSLTPYLFDAEAEKQGQRGNQDSVILLRQKSLTVFWALRQWTNYY